MFGLTVVTAPAVEPLTADEAKAHLRYPYEDQDLLIRSLIVSARRYCEKATGKAFVTQTLRLTRDRFPDYRDCYEFRLPQPPLQTVTNIQYTDSNGVLQTVDPSTYVVDATQEVGRIGLAWGETWPTDAIDQIAAVKVNYVAGYGLASAVPDTLKSAMKLLIEHGFQNREAVSDGQFYEVPLAVKSLLGVEWSGSYVGTFG